ncbi:UNVERIFIED_CONTAM: hypothetical protein PYX00_011031 [Menopon gallinae]|uniref:Geranylgeranyl transferase type II subunit alpha n=1 Tax=Menopon gallinae TaxID=328185 RepID=A0AAW2H6N1_9NEOP
MVCQCARLCRLPEATLPAAARSSTASHAPGTHQAAVCLEGTWKQRTAPKLRHGAGVRPGSARQRGTARGKASGSFVLRAASPWMDRIDKFLKSRLSKSRRIIRVGDREVEITKEDVKKVRRYMNRECLDSIDLHAPCNTAYSRVPGEAVVKHKRDVSLAMQQRDIRRLQGKRTQAPAAARKVKMPEWPLGECAGGDELANLEGYDPGKHLSEHVFSREALASYYKELELMYTRPREKGKCIIADKFEVSTRYPRREAKILPLGPCSAVHRGWGLVVDEAACRYSVVDTKGGVAARCADGRRVCAAGGSVFALVRGRVVAERLFSGAEAFYSVHTADGAASVHVSRDVQERSEPEDEEVLDFAASSESIALATKRCVVLHSRRTGKTRRFRFNGLQKMVLAGGVLYVLAQNMLYRVDMQSAGKEIVCAGVNAFSAGGVVIAASSESVVVCGRRMYQGSLVRDVQAHRTLPIFCAATAGELRVFCYKMEDCGLKVRLCRRIAGRFSGVMFHERHHWLYAHREGLPRLYEDDAASLTALMEKRGDREALMALVQVVPDDYYAWHVLSECRDTAFLHASERALASNPKSYPAWHHRRLCVQALATDEILRREDRLTRLLISHDPRNFHAWAYRRALGLSTIRDVFNYSCLHDLVVRGQDVDARAVIATDPYFEGGHSLLRFQRENIIHLKVFRTRQSLNFPQPFMGRVILDGEVRDLEHPVLQCWFQRTCAATPRISVGGRVFQTQHVAIDTRFLDDLLRTDPDCALLHLSRLWGATDRAPLVSRLCRLDAHRQTWYRSLGNCSFRLLRLVEVPDAAAAE